MYSKPGSPGRLLKTLGTLTVRKMGLDEPPRAADHIAAFEFVVSPVSLDPSRPQAEEEPARTYLARIPTYRGGKAPGQFGRVIHRRASYDVRSIMMASDGDPPATRTARFIVMFRAVQRVTAIFLAKGA